MPSWQSRLIALVFRIRRMIFPPPVGLDIEKERADTEALAANFKARVAFISTPAAANGVPAEWVATPETAPDGVILYFHGGSYNSGSLASHRSLVANIAHAARTRVLNVDYRLAPEHPFPAAVDDAVTAYRWLLGDFRPDQITVAGDSCGGGLALALLISLRDAQEPLPSAAVCLSPWTDLTCTGASWKTNARKDVMLNPRELVNSARFYLAGTDPKNPLASPLYADLTGLPPIFIQVGSDELLLSDATAFAERARAAGVDLTLEVWDGMQHEWHFAASLLPESRQALQRIGEYIKTGR